MRQQQHSARPPVERDQRRDQGQRVVQPQRHPVIRAGIDGRRRPQGGAVQAGTPDPDDGGGGGGGAHHGRAGSGPLTGGVPFGPLTGGNAPRQRGHAAGRYFS